MLRLAWVALVIVIGTAPFQRAMADEKKQDDAAAQKMAGTKKATIDADTLAWAKEVVDTRLPQAPDAPDLTGGRGWLNVAKPLSLRGALKGKVVVLDFWCYCCINCIHVLPDLEALEKKYKDQAFAVVGVHSAKFEHEKDDRAIREAIARYEIHHPVVNDADFKIWRAYDASAWPTFAIITPNGKLLGMLSGEGNRGELDALTHVLLERFRKIGELNTKPLPIQLAREAKVARMLSYPGKVCVDAKRGSLFVADSGHHRIVELGLNGTFKRAWGNGERGRRDGGPESSDGPTAQFFRPQGMTRVGAHDLYVCDTENHLLRRVDLKTGVVSTVAGTGKQGHARVPEGPGTKTALSNPWDVLHVPGVGLVIANAGTHQLWRLDLKTGMVGAWAGNGHEQRFDHASLMNAAFAQPSGLATDGRSLFVADSESSSIVRVGLPNGPVETWAGANKKPRDLFHFGDEDGKGLGRRFQHPLGVAIADGVLYVADSYNHKIKAVGIRGGIARVVKTRWGNGKPGHANRKGVRTTTFAQFDDPGGIAANGHELYVADTNNHAIRRIDTKTGDVTTLVLRDVPIPMSHAARSAVVPTSPWPVLPSVADVLGGRLDVKAGTPWTLALTIDVPLGWKLTPGAPARWRVKAANGEVLSIGAFESGRAQGSLKAMVPGDHKLIVQWVYYVCTDAEDGGVCRVRAVDMPVTVRASDTGSSTVTLTDRNP